VTEDIFTFIMGRLKRTIKSLESLNLKNRNNSARSGTIDNHK